MAVTKIGWLRWLVEGVLDTGESVRCNVYYRHAAGLSGLGSYRVIGSGTGEIGMVRETVGLPPAEVGRHCAPENITGAVRAAVAFSLAGE